MASPSINLRATTYSGCLRLGVSESGTSREVGNNCRDLDLSKLPGDQTTSYFNLWNSCDDKYTPALHEWYEDHATGSSQHSQYGLRECSDDREVRCGFFTVRGGEDDSKEDQSRAALVFAYGLQPDTDSNHHSVPLDFELLTARRLYVSETIAKAYIDNIELAFPSLSAIRSTRAIDNEPSEPNGTTDTAETGLSLH